MSSCLFSRLLPPGKGEMLRSVEAKEKSPQVLAEPQAEYGKTREEVYAGSCSYCQEREKTIQSLEARFTDKDKQIEGLEHQMADMKTNLDRMLSDKDKQNEDLKSNLELVISLKDEMLAMKGEAVKGKEEIAKTETKLSEKINGVEVQVAHVKSELKEEIAKTETKLSEKINGVEAQVVHARGEFKEEMGKLIEMILQGQLKAGESSKVQTRWVVGAVFAVMGLILTFLGLIVTFYMKK